MADITVENLAHASNWKACSRSQVMVSASIGYQFFVGNLVDLHYRKTSDGGATWGSRVDVRAGTIDCFDVWYDRWTPGNTGTVIHIAYQDSVTDDIFYRSLDTDDDSFGTETVAFAGATFTGAIGSDWDDRCISITRARGGNLYIMSNPDTGVERGFYRSTDAGGSWSARTAHPVAAEIFQIFPANTSDTQDVCAVTAAPSGASQALRPRVYDDSGNAWFESAEMAVVTESVSYFQMAGSVRLSDNRIIFVVWNALDTASSDLLAFELNPQAAVAGGVTVTALTNVLTDMNEYAQCCVFIDQNTDDLYVGYLGNATWAVNAEVFYKKSTDGGTTWGDQTRIDATQDDARVIWCDLGGTATRFIPSWQNADLDDILVNVDNSVVIEGGPTPVPVSDTVTVVMTDVLSVLSTLQTSDAVAVAMQDTLQILASTQVSDTATVLLDELLQVAVSHTLSDLVAVSLLEAVQLVVALPLSDTAEVALLEALQILVTLPISDTATVAVLDALQILATQAVSDTVAVAVVDTVQVMVAQNLSDTVIVTLAEQISTLVQLQVSDAAILTLLEDLTLAVSLGLTDTAALSLLDTLAIQAQTTVADTVAVGVDEAVAIQADLAVSDTAAVSVQDLITQLQVAVAVADTVTVTVADIAAILATLHVDDVLAVVLDDTDQPVITVGEGDVLQVPVSDTLTVTLADVLDTILVATALTDTVVVVGDDQIQSIRVAVAVADTLSVTVAEALEVMAQLQVADTLSLTLVEIGALAVMVLATVQDTLAVGVDEQLSLLVRADLQDTLPVSLDDGLGILAQLNVSDVLPVGLDESGQAALSISVADTLAVIMVDAAVVIEVVFHLLGPSLVATTRSMLTTYATVPLLGAWTTQSHFQGYEAIPV